jgi:hypothetical protein
MLALRACGGGSLVVVEVLMVPTSDAHSFYDVTFFIVNTGHFLCLV